MLLPLPGSTDPAAAAAVAVLGRMGSAPLLEDTAHSRWARGRTVRWVVEPPVAAAAAAEDGDLPAC